MYVNYGFVTERNRMARRTRQEALETRSRILDAAERVFHEKGVANGSLEEIAATWQLEKCFEPAMDRALAAERRARWHQAVERSRGWATS